MANPPIGNDFFEGPLGVCRLEFDGLAMGKTLEGVDVEWIEDIKDILYDQDGTQPNDKIPTGQAYQVTTSLAEITIKRMQKHLRGVTLGGTEHSALLGRDIYRSGFNNFAKELILRRVDSDGEASSDVNFRLKFWKAFPQVNGPLGSFGPDSQRVYEVVFYCFYDSDNGGFGFFGHASSLGL